MSYLDVPRLHFAGDFLSDPSTVNNRSPNYIPGAGINPLWNAAGKHWFRFDACTVRTALDSAGRLVQTSAADPMIGATITSARDRDSARLVDLDVEQQNASQIWGLELSISLPGGAGDVIGTMATGTLRDLWASDPALGLVSRAPGGFAAGFGGVYQSVLTDLRFNPPTSPTSSGLLNALYIASKLSIKFVLYAYNASPGTPRFMMGKVVGTIGLVQPNEPDHFVAARRLLGTPSQTFFHAPFKVDAARHKLVIDLGNAIPEVAPGGARQTLGTMQAQVVSSSRAAPTVLGTILYDQAHYEATAGVEELPLTAAQITLLQSSPVSITVSAGPAGIVLAERPGGSYLDVSEIALRLNPGESQPVEFAATVYGAPKSGQTIGLRLLPGRGPARALTFPASVTTGANGRARAIITASDPGHPRPNIDGQIYFIAFDWGVTRPGRASDQRGRITVRVFDGVAPVVSPTWAHVQPILSQYAQLYPSMTSIFDLGNYTIVKGLADAGVLRASLSRLITDPHYMPVTRDLSEAKKNLIFRWIVRGCPR